MLGNLLAGNGRVLFIDEHVGERGKEAYVAGRDEVVERRLRDGSTFRVVKNFVDPQELEFRLRRLGLHDPPGRQRLGLWQGASREVARLAPVPAISTALTGPGKPAVGGHHRRPRQTQHPNAKLGVQSHPGYAQSLWIGA